MPKHIADIKTVRRRDFGLERITLIVRCPDCSYRVETRDELIAHRLKRNHQLDNADTQGASA